MPRSWPRTTASIAPTARCASAPSRAGLGDVLRPGMFVDVTAVTSEPQPTILVPLASVRRSPQWPARVRPRRRGRQAARPPARRRDGPRRQRRHRHRQGPSRRRPDRQRPAHSSCARAPSSRTRRASRRLPAKSAPTESEAEPMRAIEIFVRRPVLAIVINLALVLIGLRAATQLPIQQYPRIESSSIIITTVYVGASAEVIRGFVTTPIERAVSSISGIDYVESSSVAGFSTVTARLKLNHPSTVALAEVGNRLDQIRSELPDGDRIARSSRCSAPTGPTRRSMSASRRKRMTPPQVTDYLTRNIQPRLRRSPTCSASASKARARRPCASGSTRERLAAFSISAADVQARAHAQQLPRRRRPRQGQRGPGRPARQYRPAQRRRVRTPDRARGRRPASSASPTSAASSWAPRRRPPTSAITARTPSISRSGRCRASTRSASPTRLRAELEKINRCCRPKTEIALAYDGTVYMENSLKEIADDLHRDGGHRRPHRVPVPRLGAQRAGAARHHPDLADRRHGRHDAPWASRSTC